MAKALVYIIMGSDSDWPVMQDAKKVLNDFGVASEVIVSSAHRSPEKTMGLAKNAYKKGMKVIIAAAGGAAHLAGVIASHTVLPVIGVPMKTSAFKGFDSYLSTLQMPGGIPVATVSVGSAGAKNAALLALRILGVENKIINKKLRNYRKKLSEQVKEKNKRLRRSITQIKK
jgi:phosphoribosylaminoimidazole carboxylase PurE protein